MSQRFRFDWVFLVLIITLALVLRLDFLIPIDFVIDADEAIVGLMAKHINEGKAIPTFYYGQHYMGSFEPILVSFCFKLFGISSFALKIVPLIFSLLLIVVVYFIGREIGGIWCARTAALFTAFPAAPLVVWSGKARGGFVEILFLGACALLFTIKWLKQNTPSYDRTFIIGFILGFGWWTNNQIIFFMLPVGFFMFGKLAWLLDRSIYNRLKVVIAHGLTGLIAFIIGGAPFWIYNLNYKFVSFEMFGSAERHDLIKHVSGLFSTSLPIILGAKRFWEYEDLFPYASLLGFALFGSLFIVVVAVRFKALSELLIFRVSSNQHVELLLVFIFGTLAVFSLSSFGYLVQAPRYLLPLYIGLYIVSGKAIELIAGRSRNMAIAFILGVLSFNLSSCYIDSRAIPGEPFVYKQQRVVRDHTELIRWLSERSINMVRTNYWIGYRLSFETNERILFSVFQDPPQVRIKQYEELADKQGREHLPFILVPAQLGLVEQGLRAFGIDYSVEDVSGYKVVYDLKTHEHPFRILKNDQFEVSASNNSEVARAAVDGDIETRWGSGTSQKPGMTYTLNFKRPIYLTGMRYHLGQWFHDYPRKLRIEAILPNGERKVILDDADSEGVRYLSYSNSEWTVYLDPVEAVGLELVQLGEGQIFDWSIGELDILEATNIS